MKDCLLVTSVSGAAYHAFLPLLAWSCQRAYPEYDLMVFLTETLDGEVRRCLEESGLDRHLILREAYLGPVGRILSQQAGCLRWALWDECFADYRYLYLIDTDMFYIREPKPLHLQHAERLAQSGLPFDNVRRDTPVRVRPALLAQKFRYYGLKTLLNLPLQRTVTLHRLSGLHFVETERYFTPECRALMDGIREKIRKGGFPYPGLPAVSNEAVLYRMMTQLGYDCSRLGIMRDNVTMLPFEDNLRSEFRPHHGIHLGIFRSGIPAGAAAAESRRILDSPTYAYYLHQYAALRQERDFIALRSLLSAKTERYLQLLDSYYGLDGRTPETPTP